MGEEIERAAAMLRGAYRSGPIAPMRSWVDSKDGATAYAIQAINTRYWLASGRRAIGRKIGLTAKTVQAQLGVDQPDFGVLFEDMLIPDGGVLAPSQLIQPKVEGEVALILAKDFADPDATAATIAAASAYAVAALEIVDSRIADWKITFADTVADNGSAAFFVLGAARTPLAGLDLVNCKMALTVNGQTKSTGVGAACLGHPFEAAAWLARTLARAGEQLRAGDILMTGALGPMVALQPGDRVEVSIEGLGQTRFHFEERAHD